MALDGGGGGGESKFKLAHVSDIHFGKIAHPGIVDALVDDVNGADADLVVVSGDLTQRAFPHQYEAAAAMLARFDAPWICVPGNHDVYPWWRPVLRLFDPLRRYRNWITDDLSPGFRLPGLAVLGINSAFGRTVKGGRIDKVQRDTMRAFFGGVQNGDFRVLAIHHHLTALKELGTHDVARDAKITLECAAEMNIDLILCGHLHISHVAHVQVVSTYRPFVIVSAGTATSSRGRKVHRKTNFYNLIHVEADSFRIEERKFDPSSLSFREERVTAFER